MHQNLSPMDRDIRIAIVAPILLVIALDMGAGAAGTLAFLIAIYAVVTAVAGIDPSYTLFVRATAQRA